MFLAFVRPFWCNSMFHSIFFVLHLNVSFCNKISEVFFTCQKYCACNIEIQNVIVFNGAVTRNVCVCIFLWSLTSRSWKCKCWVWTESLTTMKTQTLRVNKAQRPVHTVRLHLRFTLIFAAKISRHSIDNNVKMLTQTQTQSVNGSLETH